MFLRILKLFAFWTLAFNNFELSLTAEGKYLELPALGRTAELGFLYDELTDQFRDVNVFRQAIPNEFIIESINSKRTTKAGFINTFAEKFRLLNIDSNTAVNILSGILNVDEGATVFLNEENQSKNDVLGILFLKYQTVEESLQIYYDALKPFYNTDVLHHKAATHLVTGITWGANVAITFKGTSSANQDDSQSQEDPNSSMKKEMESEFDVFKGIRNPSNFSNEIYNFSVRANSDIFIPNNFPATQNQVQKLVDGIPQLLKNNMDGKGVPIQFRLTPLHVLKNYLKLTTEPSSGFAPDVNEWIFQDIVRIFDEISAVHQEFNDLKSRMKLDKSCAQSGAGNKILDLQISFIERSTKFKLSLKTTLDRSRSGIVSSTFLSDLVHTYYTEEFSATNVTRKLNEIKTDLENIGSCGFKDPEQRKYKLEIEVEELREALKEVAEVVSRHAQFLQIDDGNGCVLNNTLSKGGAICGSSNGSYNYDLTTRYKEMLCKFRDYECKVSPCDGARCDDSSTTTSASTEPSTDDPQTPSTMATTEATVTPTTTATTTTMTTTEAATTTTKTPLPTPLPLHRYWNGGASDHFYTTNWDELGGGKGGYAYEGVEGLCFPSAVQGTVPLHRYYNGGNGDHFYTSNWAELGGGRGGYAYEGVQCYVYPTSTDGTVPLYRYYNGGNGDHFYTTNYNEIKGGAHGWGSEGIAGYIFPKGT